MGCLHSAALLSVLFACGMVAAQYRFYDMPSQWVSDPFGNNNRRQYMCGESNLQYDCIFSDVSIGRDTHGVHFGDEDWTLNHQQNITFKNSVIKTLPEALLDSFRYIELLNLTGLQIVGFERFALTNGMYIRKLYMDFNDIRELPIFAFRNMRFLNVLTMDRNELSMLPEGIFYGTPNLTALSIVNNNLKRIDDHTFTKTKALQYLRVSGNKLTHIDLSRVLSLVHGNVSSNLLTTLSIPEAVVVLDASHNRINTVTGPNNHHLTILRLQHNNLTDTQWLLHFSGLVDVDLSHNQLEELTLQHFKNTYRLERLYVAHNRLVVLNSGPSFIRTLQILDVRHNRLLYVEENQPQFDTLEHLYLDHNSLVTLRLSPNNALLKLTLSHNDWDCNGLDQLFLNVSESVIGDSDRQCMEDHQITQSFCCKESDNAYHDRLKQYINLTIDLEKSRRAAERCDASVTIDSIQNLNSYLIRYDGVQPSLVLQEEVNLLEVDIQQLSYQQSQFEPILHQLNTELDNHLRKYGVIKIELVGPNENLRKLFAYLDNRRIFKEQERMNRQLEADRKRQDGAVQMQENNYLQEQVNAKKRDLNVIKRDTQRKESVVKRLKAKLKNMGLTK